MNNIGIRIFFICILTASLLGCANSLFYYPNKIIYRTPAKAGQYYEDVYFNSADNTKLHGWFVPAIGEPKGTVIHFHSNAQNISAHYSLVYWLPNEGFNLFTFDYRGYGQSEGTPSREGIYQDSLAAIEYIKSREDLDPEKLLVLGQSLGGAIAIITVAERRYTGIHAVAVESTFTSYQDIAAEKVRKEPVTGPVIASSGPLLASDKYSPKDYISKISPTPLLMIHGTRDRVIPVSHSIKLMEKASQPKTIIMLEGGRHLQAFSKYLPQTRQKVVEFYETALASN